MLFKLGRLADSKWFYPSLIYLGSLYFSLVYALRHFEIVSDSLLEYKTYLVYINQAHWTPLIDNILSSSLWTTYLPAVIQKLVHLEDPGTIYRLTLALLISPLPLLIYTLCRKFTSVGVSIGLAIFSFTTFYYQGSISYTRMLVALELVIVILLMVTYKTRWRYLVLILASIGLVVAHYTTTYIYTSLFVGSSISIIIYSILRRRLLDNTYLIIVATFILVVGIWFMYTRQVVAVSDYASSVVGRIRSDITNVGIPTEVLPMQVIPSIKIDMLIAKGLLGLRLLVSLIVVSLLVVKSKGGFTLVNILLVGRILGLVLVFTLQSVETAVGLLRVGFILLPIEILGLAYWWGKDRQDKYLMPFLGLASVVYH